MSKIQASLNPFFKFLSRSFAILISALNETLKWWA